MSKSFNALNFSINEEIDREFKEYKDQQVNVLVASRGDVFLEYFGTVVEETEKTLKLKDRFFGGLTEAQIHRFLVLTRKIFKGI